MVSSVVLTVRSDAGEETVSTPLACAIKIYFTEHEQGFNLIQ